MAQEPLFQGEQLPLRVAYQQLFQYLPHLPADPAAGRGRPVVSRDALLRALIYRALRRPLDQLEAGSSGSRPRRKSQDETDSRCKFANLGQYFTLELLNDLW